VILRVGAPMWAHPPWRGRYLFERGRELAEYATWCNAVEGNTTFYAAPPPASIERWADQAPDGFRFVFKAPRTITHEQRLTPHSHRDLAGFLRVIAPLGERIGPIQLQLPPSFDRLDVLARFVIGLPTEFDWTVELRHAVFFDGGELHRRTDDVLRSAGVGRVVLDTRPLRLGPATTPAGAEEQRTKPDLPVVLDHVGDDPVVRVVHGDDDTVDGLARWVPVITGWLGDGRRPYVFVHQPDNRSSPTAARRFHRAVAEAIPGLAPLPDPYEGTPSLF
jgi:uncharacterized protein YecE (DUF72 family)